MKILISTIFSFYYIFCTAQSIKIEWQKTIGFKKNDAITSILEDAEHNLVLAGFSQNDGFEINLWMVKMNKNGEVLWDKVLPAHGIQNVSDIIEWNEGYLVVVNNLVAQQQNILLIEIDKNGNVLYQNPVNMDRRLRINAIVKYQKHLYLAGSRQHHTNHSITEGIIIKMDKSFNSIWEKTFIPNVSSFKNPEGLLQVQAAIIEANDIMISATGAIIVTGYASSEKVTDFWTAKVNQQAETLWEKNINEYYGGDEAYQVLLTDDDQLLIVGTRYDKLSNVGYRGNLILLDEETGKVIFSKTYKHKASNFFDRITRAIDLEDGYLLLGTSGEEPWKSKNISLELDTWLVQTDQQGNMLWEEKLKIEGEQHGSQIIKTQQGEVFIFAKTWHNTKGGTDVQIIKLKP